LPIRKTVDKIKKQLNQVNAKFNKPSGNIVLQINSKTAQLTNIKCKYIVQNTDCNPIYDIHYESITKDIQLNYKANIYQNTGIDWERVSVIVSIGNPTQNNNRPILNPLYANIYKRFQNDNMALKQMPATNMDLQKSSNFVERSEVSENQLNIDFNILNKQIINSDGKENLVSLKSYDLTTEYIYHSVPKLN
jgi:hypothetical protein